ncbi:MAG: formate/nitrite transporter family protein [Rikenellaceae bacterium]
MKSPNQVVELTYELAYKKANYSLARVLTLSALAGVYLAMGATLSILVGYGFPAASFGNPVLPKLLVGLAFPLGLALIMIVGAELFTGNAATLVPSLMQGRVTLRSMARNLTLVWIGNFIGIMIFTYPFVHLTGILSDDPWRAGLEQLAIAKCSNGFFITVIKGIAANWFVCLSVWMCYASESITERAVAIWVPISAFVIMGFEHSIANMFFIPMAMFNGADISMCDLFVKSLIPATIGNIIGGALFVGFIYGRLFGKR